MATRQLEDARIRLILDTERAEKTLDKMERKKQRFERSTDRSTRNLRATADEIGRKTTRKAQTFKQEIVKAGKGRFRAGVGRLAAGAGVGRAAAIGFGGTIGKLGMIGLAAEAVSIGLESSFLAQSNVLVGMLEEMDAEVLARALKNANNILLQPVSDAISDLKTTVGAIFPTIGQTKDFTKASLLLGEPLDPGTSWEIGTELYRINFAQRRAERQRGKLELEIISQGIGRWIGKGLKH